MKKLRELFNESRKNYADTMELEYKKQVYNSIDDYSLEEHKKIFKQELKARASYIKSNLESILNYGPNDYSLNEIEHDLKHLLPMLKRKEMWKQINWS